MGFMALWLYEDIRNKLYSIRTAEKAEPKSDENYREEENNNHFAFKITRKVFAMNCEFAFDIRRGANLHLVLKP